MTNLHPSDIPSSADAMLERTRRRIDALRGRRRRRTTGVVAAAVGVAVAVPLLVSGGGHRPAVVRVGGTPSSVSATTSLGPPAPPQTTQSSALPPPTAVPSTSVPPSTTVPLSTTVPVVPSSTVTTSGVAPCATSELTASLNDPSGAAGSVGYALVLRNSGDVTCTLDGYPGVSYVGSSGVTVGAPAQRDSVAPVVNVTLAPGGTARATLIETDAHNYPPDTCGLTTVAGLRIYPPNQTASLLVPQTTVACADTADPVLQVGPVQ